MGSSNQPFGVWLNDKELSFQPTQDEKNIVIEKSYLQFKLQVNEEKYDPSLFSIIVGTDEVLTGFEIPLWVNNEEGILYSRENSTDQIVGLKLFGRCAIELCYKGKSLFGFTTVVRFAPLQSIQDKVAHMRKTLEKANSIILDIYGLANEYFSCQKEYCKQGDEVEMENFLILHHFYVQALPFFRLQPQQLHSILLRTGTGNMVPVAKAHPITFQKITEAYRNGESLRQVHTRGTTQRGTAMHWLPIHMPSYTPSLSYDTLANRNVLGLLKEMYGEARKVEEVLYAELKSIEEQTIYFGAFALFHEYKKRRLLNAYHHCSSIVGEIKKRITVFKDLGVRSEVARRQIPQMWLNASYRAFYSAFTTYFRQKSVLPYIVIVNSDTYPLQTRSINGLYEIWVVHTILKILIEQLGFTKVEVWNKTADIPSNYILKSGQTVDLKSPLGERVLFHYDKKYSSLENSFCMEQVGFVSRRIIGEQNRVQKNNPDISIEFYSTYEAEPRIVIFDATFSNNPRVHYLKTLYQETIWYRPTLDAPKENWSAPVIAAIAVHPFLQEDELPTFGEFSLVPQEGIEEQAFSWLHRFFRKHRLI